MCVYSVGVHQRVCYSLQALFECSVNLLQSFGLRLSGAAASLVTRQVGLFGLGLRLLLHCRVPHERVTPIHANAHKHILVSPPRACFFLRGAGIFFKLDFKQEKQDKGGPFST